MSTMVEQRVQPLGGYDSYDHMRFGRSTHFTNPWDSSSGSRQLYNQHQNHTSPAPNDSYVAQQYPSETSSLRSVDPISQSRSYAGDYTSIAPASAPSYTATTAADQHSNAQYQSTYGSYEQRYAQYQQNQDHARRQSMDMKSSLAGRSSFSDALDGAQGMVAMSQQDFTPRSVYAPRNNSGASYGYPSNQSDQDSASSGSNYPYYGSYNGSIDGSAGSSVTDYSASSSEDMGQRNLPPPGQLVNGFPADATQMMTQFNSKLAASAQKKHKCKICDKRFTRPSSLQTHMYSHTGEKPFSCDFEGCGRHFSVVSNLRRHKKCHKSGSTGDADSTGSPEDMESED